MCNYKTLASLVLNLLLISGAVTLPSACNTAGIGLILLIGLVVLLFR